MRTHRHLFSLELMAKTLGVSRQGYYHFIKRPFSRRAFENQKISEEIKLIFKKSYDTYGSPRIHAELKARGCPFKSKSSKVDE